MQSDRLGLAGHIISKYSVVRHRGNGAFADVYEALHLPTASPVALKVLRPTADLDSQREFYNEGQLLLKVAKSSGVVDILDSSKESVEVQMPNGMVTAIDLRFHVLELAEACLDELVANLPSLDWASRLSLLRDTVLGVHQMHGKRLVHRDLKSSNVLLFEDRGKVTAKLNDLGRARDLARPGAADRIAYQFPRGDPNFAPPEFLWGAGVDTEVAHRCCDLYGLGSILFELALGQGITGLAVYPNQAVVLPYHELGAADRRRAYQARLPEIRSWYQPMYDMFDLAIPKEIRQSGGALIRQLCDPDPFRRLPRIALGRRGLRANELCWLLNRIDSIRLTLSNSQKQSQRLQVMKAGKEMTLSAATIIDTSLAAPLDLQTADPAEIADATLMRNAFRSDVPLVQLRSPDRRSGGSVVPEPRQAAAREYVEAERSGILAQALSLTLAAPGSPTALARLAQSLLTAGEHERAVEVARRVRNLIENSKSRSDPSMSAAGLVAARVLAFTDHDNDAEIVLRDLPASADHAILSAGIAARRGDHTLALDRLKDQGTAAVLAYRGYLLLTMNCPQAALTALRSARNRGDISANLHLNLAYAFAASGSPRKAIAAARQAVAIAPLSRQASFNLAGYLRASGHFDECLHELLRLRKILGKDDPLVAAALAQAYSATGNPRQGLRELRRAHHHNSFDSDPGTLAELKANLSLVEWKIGESNREDVLRTVVEQIASSGPTVALAKMLVDVGSTFKILPYFERIYKELSAVVSPGELAPLTIRLLVLRRQVSRAAKLAIEYADQHPLDLEEVRGAIILRGQALGDYPGAAAMGLDALRRMPGDPALVNNTAFCLAHAGRTDEAMRVLSRVNIGDDPYLMATRALVEFARGGLESGLRGYDAASRLIDSGCMHSDDRVLLQHVLRANETLAIYWFGLDSSPEVPGELKVLALPDGYKADLRFDLICAMADRLGVDYSGGVIRKE